MKIKSSRLYSYPVLSAMHDDYINSSFKIKVKAFKKTKNMLININCSLDNNELLSLIDNNKAKIVCHFECQKTKLRYTKDLALGENNFEIPNADINEQLQIVAFVVSIKEIIGYYSKSFNPDYGSSKFNIEIGSVLAISNQPDIPIEKNIYDLSNVPSIISIVPYNNENDHKIYIDMDDNIFIPISRLNEMRRVLCNKLEDIRSNNKKEVIKKEIVYDRSKTVKTSYLIVKVRNEAQLMYLIDKDVIIVTDYYSLYKKFIM